MSGQPPLVSILMPTFNASQFIEDSLRSIACQGIERLEVVISDGGSTDDTLDRARTVASEHGLLLRVLPGADTGQSHGLNRALAASQGDILGWMNASDEYRNGSLIPLIESLRANDRVLLAYGHHEVIDEAGNPTAWAPALPPWAWVHRHESFVMNAQSMLWRRELQNRVGGFDEALHRTMDYDLIQRFLDATGPGEARRLDVTVGRFRHHEGQKTSNGPGSVVFDEHMAIQKKLGRRSARHTRSLLPFWLAGRLVRLATVIRFEGFAGLRRVVTGRPRVVPVRQSHV
jgi:glycosyltransferase involved in cell wall biosynthesis